MRKYIDIINEQYLKEIAELNRIEAEFKRNFWHCTSSEPDLQIWEHMDDDTIGMYWVHLRNGQITYIEYRSSLSRVFNRVFFTTGAFIKHIIELTDEPIDDEAMARGGAKLRDIAKKLRGEENDGQIN